MHVLYDHLTAVIVGSVVFFILVAVQLRSTETSHDQTRYYAAKAHLLNMQEMIEHDFKNIGAGVAVNDSIFITKTDSEFTFMAKLDADEDEPLEVSYQWEQVDTVDIEGETIPLYQISRYVDDVLTGQGASLMREIEIELRDGQRQPVADFDDVEAVYVKLVLTSPLGETDKMHEARWSRTFIPPNLSNN